MVKKRSTALVILLSICTCGIYTIILYCQLGSATNKICEGDGKKQVHCLVAALLLGPITLYIYPLVWAYKAMTRLQDNAYRYGPQLQVSYSGGSYVAWTLLGIWIGIGPLVAMSQFNSDVSAFADFYGYVQLLQYTENKLERIELAKNANYGMPNVVVQVVNQNPPQQYGNVQNQTPLPPQNKPAQINAPIENANTNAGSFADEPYKTVAKSYDFTGKITGLSGMYSGYEFPIQSGEIVTFGTDPQFCQIVLESSSIEGRYCTVSYNNQKGNYTVVDYSSAGVYLEDGDRIAGNVSVLLDGKTNIYLGDRSNGFRLG